MGNNETGFPFLRRLDGVGRIVIPMDLRRALGWKENTTLVLCVQGDTLVVKEERER